MTRAETVGEVGERELIRRLSPFTLVGKSLSGLLGIGDDCAVLPADSSRRVVLTTDLLIEGTHFLRNAQTDWKGVGRKAAGANISDLAAMGAEPVCLLVSVALPPDVLVTDVLSLYQGIHDFAARIGAPVVGGDTTRARQICISITAVGLKDMASAGCLRSDAAPGDFVYVTGDLGGSRAGLEQLLDSRQGIDSDFQAKQNEAVERHYSPPVRVDVGLALAKNFPSVAIIDISDSLFNEAGLICEASSVALELNLDAIPVHAAAVSWCEVRHQNPHQFALYSGEEYELLFTLPVPPDELRNKFGEAGVTCRVSHVGTVNPGSGVRLLKGGHPVDPDDKTFVHFS